MKKSLHVGVFNSDYIHQASPYCGDNVFANGFLENGYQPFRFDYRGTNNPNEDLLKFANEVIPDLFFFGKCERISFETIKRLKETYPNVPFIKWGADVRHMPTAHDLGHNQYIDWFFATYGGDYLKAHLLQNMEGVCSILTFTDSLFYNENEKSTIYDDIDVLWTGRRNIGDNPMRDEIIDTLINTSGLNISVFGINNDWLGYPDYLQAINGSKIGIGSNSFNRKKYSSDRLGNYMSCGLFYLTQKIEGLDECFIPGKDLDTFETTYEMTEKIKYYLNNPEERERIAKSGQEKVREFFDTKPLVENILHVIETKQSNYPWDDVYTN